MSYASDALIDALGRNVDRLERENGQLKYENEKLREKARRQADELTALRKAIEQRNGEFRPWKRQAERFVAENAKLRELVRDALTTISWCTIDCYPSDNKKRELNERARELGVETDA